jgi:hypothetical protein
MANLATNPYYTDKRFTTVGRGVIGLNFADGVDFSRLGVSPSRGADGTQNALTYATAFQPIGQAMSAGGSTVAYTQAISTYNGRLFAYVQNTGATNIASGGVISGNYINAGPWALLPGLWATGIDMTTAAKPTPT